MKGNTEEARNIIKGLLFGNCLNREHYESQAKKWLQKDNENFSEKIKEVCEMLDLKKPTPPNIPEGRVYKNEKLVKSK